MIAIMGAITSADATKANEITVKFASALPADAAVTLLKGTADTNVKAVIDEARTTATFKSDSNFQTGTYTVTVTAGGNTSSKDVEVKERAVSDIVMKSKTALTSDDMKKLYLYYDVVDQYGESMRASTSITWTSGSGTVKVDKSTGCITISSTDGKAYTYGTNVYIVGVDVKSGKNVNATIPVGMKRALDSIKFEGFINVDDKKIIETLPKNFSENKYRLLFTAYDQDGNPMEASGEYTNPPTGSNKSVQVTFIADNATLIKPEFKDGRIDTINGKEYCSVTVQPGMYVDKGGEVNITAISNTTGTKTTKNFVIGAAAVLKSLSLTNPSGIVADGDKDIDIPFVAKDTEGKEVTNYETIVRSSNSLKLTATEGILTVYETESGTAKIKWTDDDKYIINNGNREAVFDESSTYDGVDRNISLVTVVVGGESNNLMMNVSDARRPVAVKSVKLNDDNNDIIAENSSAEIDFFSDKVKYIDQYGAEVTDDRAKSFFKNAVDGFGKNNTKFGVKADITTVQDKDIDLATLINSGTPIKDGDTVKSVVLQNDGTHNKLNIKTKARDDVNNTNIRYSVVEYAKSGNESTWDTVDAEKSINYTIVPVDKISDINIDSISKVRLETEWSEKDVYEVEKNVTSPSAVIAATVGTVRDVKLTGTYDGKKITIPTSFYNVEGDELNPTFKVEKADAMKAQIKGIKASATKDDAIKYSDLYDFSKRTRKDARKILRAEVKKGDKTLATPKTYVTVSDEARTPAKIEFYQNWSAANKLTLSASNTEMQLVSKKNAEGKYESGIIKGVQLRENWQNTAMHGQGTGDLWLADGGPAVLVFDQYGDGIYVKNLINGIGVADESKPYPYVNVEFSISNIKENTDEFAHVSKNFAVTANNSDTASIKGVEIKDTFDLTATVAGTNLSVKVPVTAGADTKANITNKSEDNDKKLREILGCSRQS